MHPVKSSGRPNGRGAAEEHRRGNLRRRQSFQWGRLLTLVLLSDAWGCEGACRFGELPGTMQEDVGGELSWQVFDEQCQIQQILPAYIGSHSLDNATYGQDRQALRPITMFFLGDSVDRSAVWDVNGSAFAKHTPGLQSMIEEHWRAAIKLPNLDMVYQFTPGSHTIGPYHDDVLWNKTIVNALPRGYEMHRLLTGQEEPDVFVFSNILWDLGRWLFLSEIAEPERMEHYGKPLLREQEYLPDALLEEFRSDTEVQMQRIENLVSRSTVLIYHNAAFAKLKNCSESTMHARTGLGRRTHLVQLNALTRQIVAENPRWQLVDFGAMSQASLGGKHLEDEHHPKSSFMLQAVNIYLNIYYEHGPKNAPRHGHVVGNVQKWDEEYMHRKEEMEAGYAREAGAEESRYHLRKEASKIRRKEELRHKPHNHRSFKMLFNVTIGKH